MPAKQLHGRALNGAQGVDLFGPGGLYDKAHQLSMTMIRA
jgi:hypothetical protein